MNKEEYLKHLTAEQALDEELIQCALGTLESFRSPFEALQAVIGWHVGVALYFREQE